MPSIFNFVTKEGKHFAPIVNEVPAGYRAATDEEIANNQIRKYEGSDGTQYVADPTRGTKLQSGVKGVFAKVRFENNSTEKAELFAVNTQTFLSSN